MMDDLNELAAKEGRGNLAAKLGVSRQTLWLWIADGVPAKRVVEIEGITNIPRYRLRPDLYLPAPAPASECGE